jgi:LmbE family N-acetylglucosaminyl deacetylase
MLEKVLRRLYRWVMPRNAKSSLRLRLLLDERDKPPTEITDFNVPSVVVLAPHMDDEVIGCGGAVRHHVLAGAVVTVVFMTDGTRGRRDLHERPTLDADARARSEAALAEQRRGESSRAAELLGIQELVFLGARDSELDVEPQIVGALLEVFERTVPDLIYVPSMFDLHVDHWATNRVLDRCLEVGFPKSAHVTLREYEVWTPLLVNRLAVIDDVVQDKKLALEQFESQNPNRLVNVALGLNRYRSIYLYHARDREYAEAFYESSPDQYRLLFRRFTEKR